MAFGTSTTKTRESVWGEVIWRVTANSKNPKLPAPNLAFYNKDSKATDFLIPDGGKGQVVVTGVPIGISAFVKEGFGDRKKNQGKKPEEKVMNEWRLRIALDSGSDEPLSVLSAKLIGDNGKCDRDSLQLLNICHALAMKIKSGEIEKGTPIQIGLYKNAKGYAATTMRLPSGYDGQTPLFENAKLTVHADAMPPKVERRLDANGVPLEIEGIPLYEWGPSIAWAEQKVGEILEVFGKHEDQEVDNAGADAPSADDGDDAVLVGEAVAAAVDNRPRMAG